MLVKGWRFVRVLDQLEGINRWVVLRGYIATQAATMFPGGVAARAGILEQAGVPVERSAAAIAYSSFSDQITLIACALLSAMWFEVARKPVGIMLTVLAIISVLLGLDATRTWLMSIVNWLMGKFHWRDKWHKFKKSVLELATVPNLLAGIGNSALACALMVIALDLCVRGIGAQIPYPTLLLAFALPSLLGRISAMPGGAGVTEAGMIGVLDAHPGITLHQAAASVFLFRIGTVLFTALLGVLCYFFAWQGKKEDATEDVSNESTDILPVDSLVQSTLIAPTPPRHT